MVTIVKAACPHDCPDTCAMEVTADDGVAVEVRGGAMPFNGGRSAPRSRSTWTVPTRRSACSIRCGGSARRVSGECVRVFNDRGSYTLKAAVPDRARPGVVVAPSVWWRKLFARRPQRERPPLPGACRHGRGGDPLRLPGRGGTGLGARFGRAGRRVRKLNTAWLNARGLSRGVQCVAAGITARWAPGMQRRSSSSAIRCTRTVCCPSTTSVGTVIPRIFSRASIGAEPRNCISVCTARALRNRLARSAGGRPSK